MRQIWVPSHGIFWVALLFMAACDSKQTTDETGGKRLSYPSETTQSKEPWEFGSLLELVESVGTEIEVNGAVTPKARSVLDPVKASLAKRTVDEQGRVRDNFAAYIILRSLLSARLYEELVPYLDGGPLDPSRVRRTISEFEALASKYPYAKSRLSSGGAIYSLLIKAKDNPDFRKKFQRDREAFEAAAAIVLARGSETYKYVFGGKLIDKIYILDIKSENVPKSWLRADTSAADPVAKKRKSKRDEAMEFLGKAKMLLVGQYGTTMNKRNFNKSLRLVDNSLKLDPNLAIAHVVRGQFAIQNSNWAKAVHHLEIAARLLEQPGQPLNPPGQHEGAEVTLPELLGEVQCMLGYANIELAKRAHHNRQPLIEQKYLEKAYNNLKLGLSKKPPPPVRQMAEGLMRLFQQVP